MKLLECVAKMLVNGGFADLELLGDFSEFQAVAKVQQDDLSTHGRMQEVNALPQLLGVFFEQGGGGCIGFHVQQVEALHLLVQLSVTQSVEASVSHAGQQKGFDGVGTEMGAAVEQMGKDIVYHVFAVCFVMQEHHRHAEHGSVVLPEQRFEFFSVCHTLFIHAKSNLLNPWDDIFVGKDAKRGMRQNASLDTSKVV